MYDHLRQLGVLRSGARVLEVGAGTGQATGEFVAAGGRVVALEPGPAMASRPRPDTPRPDPLDADGWMRALTAGDRFEPLEATRFPWQIDLTAQQVRDLFSTFSDWSAEEVDEAGASVDGLGGRVTEHYVTVLCVCRART